MNYVKVKATIDNINLSLFVPESQIGKKLRELQELHLQIAPHGECVLSVSMRRVKVDLMKVRGLKDKLLPLSNIPTVHQIAA